MRVGGFRVGVVDDDRSPQSRRPTASTRDRGRRHEARQDGRAAARRHARSRVRPRSALGLKYVELTPGHSAGELARGRHDPARRTPASRVEFDDLFSTLRQDARQLAARRSTGFGDAFAGRGASINEAIAALNPFFTHLTPVMKNLVRPGHRARRVLQADRRGLGPGRAGRASRPSCSRRWRTPSPRSSRDPQALQADDREVAADARRRRSDASASSGRSWPTSPTSRAGCGPPRSDCRDRCPRSTPRSRPARRCCRAPWS